MSKTNMKLFAVIVLAMSLLLIGAAPLVVRSQEKTLDEKPVVLLEIFTATWDPACGGIGIITDDISDNFGSGNLAIIAHHFSQKNGEADPFRLLDSIDRLDYYPDIKGIPATEIDGIIMYSGDKISYIALGYNINKQLNPPNSPRNFEITISGDVKSGSVDVEINQLATSSATNVSVRYALTESNIYFPGTNSTDPDWTYQNVARVLPPEDKLTLPLAQPVTFTKTYNIDPTWVKENLSFVAYIQSDATKEVLQAATYGYTYGAPEISPLVVIPLGGIMVAIFAFSLRRKREGNAI